MSPRETPTDPYPYETGARVRHSRPRRRSSSESSYSSRRLRSSSSSSGGRVRRRAERPRVFADRLTRQLQQVARLNPKVSAVPAEYERIYGVKLDYYPYNNLQALLRHTPGIVVQGSKIALAPGVRVSEETLYAPNPVLLEKADLAPEDRNAILKRLNGKLKLEHLRARVRIVMCQRCDSVAFHPVVLSCRHWYCTPCFKRLLEPSAAVLRCSNVACRRPFTDHTIKKLDLKDPIAARILQVYNKLQLKCPYHLRGCPWAGSLDHLPNHMMVCTCDPQLQILRGAAVTIDSDDEDEERLQAERDRLEEQLTELMDRLFAEVDSHSPNQRDEDISLPTTTTTAGSNYITCRSVGTYKVYLSWSFDSSIAPETNTAQYQFLKVKRGDQVEVFAHRDNSIFGFVVGRQTKKDLDRPGWFPTACLKNPLITRTEFMALLNDFYEDVPSDEGELSLD